MITILRCILCLLGSTVAVAGFALIGHGISNGRIEGMVVGAAIVFGGFCVLTDNRKGEDAFDE
jgi:hypothetical protein